MALSFSFGARELARGLALLLVLATSACGPMEEDPLDPLDLSGGKAAFGLCSLEYPTGLNALPDEAAIGVSIQAVAFSPSVSWRGSLQTQIHGDSPLAWIHRGMSLDMKAPLAQISKARLMRDGLTVTLSQVQLGPQLPGTTIWQSDCKVTVDAAHQAVIYSCGDPVTSLALGFCLPDGD